MKAVCLILCLALAHESAGHIFRRQYRPRMDSLIVQPLEYIDQQDWYVQQREQAQPKVQQENVYPQLPRQQEQRYAEQQYQKTVGYQTHDSTSAESNSQERKRIQYAAPVPTNAQNWNTNFFGGQSQNMQPALGDVIEWNGVKIASGPDAPIRKEDIANIFNEAYKTMSHISEENKKNFHQTVESAMIAENEDAHLNATQLLNKYKYPVEEHTIKTDDGYFLTLFRISSKEPTLAQRPVVFLMHGLLGSADDWLLTGAKSLAFQLVDAGYEVWMGNSRGSRYSRRHVSKHPAQADFWQYSNDEIALHDLPAMIDYVLKTSNQQKMYYVGYSQGTTAFFALAATRPEYNGKIITMYALSPMAYMTNVRSPLLRMIAPNSPLYTRLHEQLGHGEFKPSKEFIHTVGGEMCENAIGCKNVCSNVNFVMAGANVDDLDVSLIPSIMAHLPAGASTRQMKQYAQGVVSNEFTKYDFGAEVNMQVYGSRQPPKYDMHNVWAPVVLYYSEEDWLAHPTDVERLVKELPNVKDAYKIPEPHFSHMGFQFSKSAPEVVYKRLIESINAQQKQQNYVY